MIMMDNQDYNQIARIIRMYLTENGLPDTAEEVADHLADYFERKDIGDFDRTQFMKNCGVIESDE